MNYRALILVPVLALFGFGCKSPSQMIAEKTTEGIMNSQLDGQGKVDLGDNGVTYEGADGSSVAYGEDVKLPPNFPSEVMIFSGAKIKAVSMNTAGGQTAVVVYQTEADATAIIVWYTNELTKAGWKKGDVASMGGTEYAVFEKANAKMTISASKVEAGSSVSISYEAGMK